MYKIALTAGHYRYTPGRRCDKSLDPNQTREWVLNDRVATKVENLLKQYEGVETMRTDDRTGETLNSLSDRTSAANAFNADLYLSFHHNGGAKLTIAGGIVVYVYGYASQASLEWQKAFYNNLILATGLRGNRATPLDKANFQELRETKMPGVLFELGFMDSLIDTPIIVTETFANQCAEAIVKTIVDKVGLIKKVKEPVEEAVEEPVTYVPSVKEWQQAAATDGYKFPKYGIDGIWGKECESVASKAIVKRRVIYSNRTLTKLVQKVVGVEVDGKCGKLTDAAIREYQKKHGLVVDGCVGINTWKKMLSV